MSFSKTALLTLLGYATGIAAHGIVQTIYANGKTIENYRPHAWKKIPTPGWEIIKDQDHGFLLPAKYHDPDIICHVDALPGKLSVTVAAGDSIGLEWNSWPLGHHGNVLNYLANCDGDCTKADKTKLKFNKITEEGLIHPNPSNPIGKNIDNISTGYWGGDKLNDNGNRTDFKVPVWLKAGNYVLRHELHALQSAMAEGRGIQHYPQCINLIVTGAGNDGLDTGVLGTDLYTADQPGVVFNIFTNPATYPVPGPPVYKPKQANSFLGLQKSSATPEKSSAAPEKKSAAPEKKSAAPEKQVTGAPSYEYSLTTSAAPEKTPVQPAYDYALPVPVKSSTSEAAYQNTSSTYTHSKATASASLKDSTTPSPDVHADVKATPTYQGSLPKKSETPDSENLQGGKKEEETGKADEYNYELPSTGATDSENLQDAPPEKKEKETGKADEYKYELPSTGTPDTGIKTTLAASVNNTTKDSSWDISISDLISLAEKTLKELRKKLLGKNISKRHARDLLF